MAGERWVVRIGQRTDETVVIGVREETVVFVVSPRGLELLRQPLEMTPQRVARLRGVLGEALIAVLAGKTWPIDDHGPNI